MTSVAVEVVLRPPLEGHERVEAAKAAAELLSAITAYKTVWHGAGDLLKPAWEAHHEMCRLANGGSA